MGEPDTKTTLILPQKGQGCIWVSYSCPWSAKLRAQACLSYTTINSTFTPSLNVFYSPHPSSFAFQKPLGQLMTTSHPQPVPTRFQLSIIWLVGSTLVCGALVPSSGEDGNLLWAGCFHNSTLPGKIRCTLLSSSTRRLLTCDLDPGVIGTLRLFKSQMKISESLAPEARRLPCMKEQAFGDTPSQEEMRAEKGEGDPHAGLPKPPPQQPGKGSELETTGHKQTLPFRSVSRV